MDEEQITINSILECLDFGLRIDEKDIQDLLDIVKKKNEIIKKQSYTNKKWKNKIKAILEEYKYTEIGDSEKIIEFYKKMQSLLEKENKNEKIF